MKTRTNMTDSGFTLIEVIIALVVVAILAAMMSAYFGTSITQSSSPIVRLQTATSLSQIMEKITAAYTYPYWSPNTAYAPGVIIRPRTISPNRTGLLYTTNAGGTSGATEPNWSTAITINSTVTGTDGTITWKTLWDSAHNTATNNGAAPTLVLLSRENNKAYTKNTVILNGSFQYLCTVAGTSGSSAPAWRTDSTPFTDGGVTWQYMGYPFVLQTAIGTAGSDGTTATDYTNTFKGESISYRVVQNSFIKFTGNAEVNINSTTNDTDYGKYLKVTIGLPMALSNRTNETLTTLFVRR